MFNDFGGGTFFPLIVVIGVVLIFGGIAVTVALAKGADAAWRRFRRRK